MSHRNGETVNDRDTFSIVYPSTAVSKSINKQDAYADISSNQHCEFQVVLVAKLPTLLFYDVTIYCGIVTSTTVDEPMTH